MKVAVCEYGAGNVRSVVLAFERLGVDAAATSDPELVVRADLAVLPGVGSARTAMQGLAARALDGALRERVAGGKPTLGICLGLQLALESSDEDGGVRGLALLPGRAVRLRKGRVPRIGWAPVDPGGEEFYFAHSYAAETPRGDRDLGRDRGRGRGRRLRRRAVPSGEERPRWSALPRAMPLPRLIPCLDVAGGRVVKGVRFQGLRDVGDPVELGEAYSDAGADELVFLDVAATVEGRDTLVGLVRRVAERLAIPFTVGGGIRTVGDAEALLEAGADKVSVNSAALARPELLTALAERLGSQAVVLAVDAKGGDVRSHAGGVETGRRAAEWAHEGEERGAGEILLTSIDTDGTRDGYDLALTGEVAAAVSVPVIASGGAGSAGHIAAALEVAQAALLASILHENPAGLVTLRDELHGLGVPLRNAA